MSTTDVTVLRTRLAEAENAQHRLITGIAAKVFVDQNGERIEYAVANAARLSQYIEQLKSQIAACTGNTSGVSGGPLCVYI